MSDAIDIGFVDYRFLDVEMALHSFMRADTFGKLEVRTTLDFYNNVCGSYNSGNCHSLELFSYKLYKENEIFRLEAVQCDNMLACNVPTCLFMFTYRLTNTLVENIAAGGSCYCDSLIAKLVNDMCKVKIENVLEGN